MKNLYDTARNIVEKSAKGLAGVLVGGMIVAGGTDALAWDQKAFENYQMHRAIDRMLENDKKALEESIEREQQKRIQEKNRQREEQQRGETQRVGDGVSLGTRDYGRGIIYIGEMKEGKPQGNGTLYVEGEIRYVGEWTKGIRHGRGILFTEGKNGKEVIYDMGSIKKLK